MKIKPTIENAHRALRDAASVMESAGAVWHLDGGTLLGFWRDGKFCLNDHDDIDLTAFGIKINDIVPGFLKFGFDIYHEWPGNTKKRWTPQVSFRRDGVKVDVMFKALKGKWINWTVYRNSKEPIFKRTPQRMTDIPVYWKFICNQKAMSFPIPKIVEEYLKYRYGNWLVPVHRSIYSCYQDDRSIISQDV